MEICLQIVSWNYFSYLISYKQNTKIIFKTSSWFLSIKYKTYKHQEIKISCVSFWYVVYISVHVYKCTWHKVWREYVVNFEFIKKWCFPLIIDLRKVVQYKFTILKKEFYIFCVISVIKDWVTVNSTKQTLIIYLSKI